MAAYFHGGTEMIQPRNDHHLSSNLYLMNPTTSFFTYTDNDPNSSTRFLDLHAPPDHHQMYGSWPMEVQECGQFPVPCSPLAVVPQSTACDTTQQGLSLTLSSRQNQGPRVPSNAKIVSHGSASQHLPSALEGFALGMPSGVVSRSRYSKATGELLDEIVSVGKSGTPTISCDGSKSEKRNKMKKVSIGVSGEDVGDTKPTAELTPTQKQELQMKRTKLFNMIEEVEQRYRQYSQQMEMVVSAFERDAGLGSAKSYTVLALQTISRKFRCLKNAIAAQIKAISKTLGEEECSRLRCLDHRYQMRQQQRTMQQFSMIQHHSPWRPQRGLPERAVFILRAWLFDHFLHPYPRDSDKQMLAKQTGLTRSQVSNWFINARVRLWKPMVEEMYLEEMKQQQGEKGSEETSTSHINQEANQEPEGPSSCTLRPTNSLQANNTRAHHFLNNPSPLGPEKSTNQNFKKTSSPTDCSKPIIMSGNLATGRKSSIQSESRLTLVHTERFNGISDQKSPKKLPRSNIVTDMQNSPSSVISLDMEMMKEQGHETNRETNHTGFGWHSPMGEIRRFGLEHLTAPRGFRGSNGVSLSLSLSENQQSFLSNHNVNTIRFGPGEELDFCGVNASQPSHPAVAAAYQNMDGHGRKRFASQFMPDFMA